MKTIKLTTQEFVMFEQELIASERERFWKNGFIIFKGIKYIGPFKPLNCQ